MLLLREKCPYSEFFWSLFSRIRTEFGEIWSIYPYSVGMPENTDQKNSEYGPFSRSIGVLSILFTVNCYFSRMYDPFCLLFHIVRRSKYSAHQFCCTW